VVTVRGAVTAALGIATIVAGRVLGMVELYVFGASMVGLVVVAVVSMRARRPRVQVVRLVSPPRVHAGQPTRVEVRAVNAGKRKAPVLMLRDPVGGTRGATLHIAPLTVGESAHATYRLPTNRRGIVSIGPLTVEVSDPLRLARAVTVAAPETDLTVLPVVEPLPEARMGDASRRRELGARSVGHQRGDEFASLRPYVQGDDLRQVHWLASARHDDLVVREDEPLRDAHLQLVLDTRAGTYNEESFETAVSIAASVIVAAGRRNEPLQLLDGDGEVFSAVTSTQRQALLEHLATVATSPAASLHRALQTIGRGTDRHSLVVVGGSFSAADLDAIVGLRRSVTELTVATTQPVDSTRTLAGINVVIAPPGASIAEAWGRSLLAGAGRP